MLVCVAVCRVSCAQSTAQRAHGSPSPRRTFLFSFLSHTLFRSSAILPSSHCPDTNYPCYSDIGSTTDTPGRCMPALADVRDGEEPVLRSSQWPPAEPVLLPMFMSIARGQWVPMGQEFHFFDASRAFTAAPAPLSGPWIPVESRGAVAPTKMILQGNAELDQALSLLMRPRLLTMLLTGPRGEDVQADEAAELSPLLCDVDHKEIGSDTAVWNAGTDNPELIPRCVHTIGTSRAHVPELLRTEADPEDDAVFRLPSVIEDSTCTSGVNLQVRGGSQSTPRRVAAAIGVRLPRVAALNQPIVVFRLAARIGEAPIFGSARGDHGG